MVTIAGEAEFNKEEFTDRLQKVWRSIAERDLDALLVCDDDRMGGGGSVRYLSNFFNTGVLSLSIVVVVPNQEPTLCIKAGFQECVFSWARMRSWVRNVKGTPSGPWDTDWVKDVLGALSEAGFSGEKIGIDSMRFMPYRLIEKLRSRLTGATLEDTAGLVEQVRQAKSPSEAELLRRAAIVSEAGMNVFSDAAKPGVVQAEAIAEAELAAKKLGAEEAMMYMGTGLPWIWGYHRGNLRFDRGAMVAAEFNARYEGYHGQVCRTLTLGDPTSKQKAMHETVVSAYKRMLAVTRPGISAEELFDAGMAVIKEEGFEYSGVRFGHGLGLSLAEGFSIAPGHKALVEKGNCLVLHPNIALPATGDAAIHGDPVLVTENGAEVLGSG
ncbi:MAG: aminopeptidase P family protein [Deltaproteobacteria bacterium]|nr:aminopeptidase P family protein [Deltaproteobacteria bacterium]